MSDASHSIGSWMNRSSRFPVIALTIVHSADDQAAIDALMWRWSAPVERRLGLGDQARTVSSDGAVGLLDHVSGLRRDSTQPGAGEGDLPEGFGCQEAIWTTVTITDAIDAGMERRAETTMMRSPNDGPFTSDDGWLCAATRFGERWVTTWRRGARLSGLSASPRAARTSLHLRRRCRGM